jgi:RNA recognition motif-containing protein
LKNAYVIYDPENKRSRGYGIIQFANPESADAIMAMNQKHYLDDKEMFLSRFNSADPKKNKPPGTELP